MPHCAFCFGPVGGKRVPFAEANHKINRKLYESYAEASRCQHDLMVAFGMSESQAWEYARRWAEAHGYRPAEENARTVLGL